MEFETASGGTVAVQRREVSIPDFGQDKLLLSDVMLSYRVEETPDGQPLGGSDIVRHSLSIMPAPWSVFSQQQPIYLYFEVYNLQVGAEGRTDFEVEARLSPKDDRKGLAGLVKGIFGGGDKGVSVTTPVSCAGDSRARSLFTLAPVLLKAFRPWRWGCWARRFWRLPQTRSRSA